MATKREKAPSGKMKTAIDAQVALRMSLQLRRKLERLAAKDGRNLSDYLRRVLTQVALAA